jgi:ABC-2 type transport system ATP-binding protein
MRYRPVTVFNAVDLEGEAGAKDRLWRLIEQRRDGARLAMVGKDASHLAAGLKKMIQDGLPVVDFHREERRLEDAFVEMLKEKQS